MIDWDSLTPEQRRELIEAERVIHTSDERVDDALVASVLASCLTYAQRGLGGGKGKKDPTQNPLVLPPLLPS